MCEEGGGLPVYPVHLEPRPPEGWLSATLSSSNMRSLCGAVMMAQAHHRTVSDRVSVHRTLARTLNTHPRPQTPWPEGYIGPERGEGKFLAVGTLWVEFREVIA